MRLRLEPLAGQKAGGFRVGDDGPVAKIDRESARAWTRDAILTVRPK